MTWSNKNPFSLINLQAIVVVFDSIVWESELIGLDSPGHPSRGGPYGKQVQTTNQGRSAQDVPCSQLSVTGHIRQHPGFTMSENSKGSLYLCKEMSWQGNEGHRQPGHASETSPKLESMWPLENLPTVAPQRLRGRHKICTPSLLWLERNKFRPGVILCGSSLAWGKTAKTRPVQLTDFFLFVLCRHIQSYPLTQSYCSLKMTLK